jgi:hypothetical protein
LAESVLTHVYAPARKVAIPSHFPFLNTAFFLKYDIYDFHIIMMKTRKLGQVCIWKLVESNSRGTTPSGSVTAEINPVTPVKRPRIYNTVAIIPDIRWIRLRKLFVLSIAIRFLAIATIFCDVNNLTLSCEESCFNQYIFTLIFSAYTKEEC